MQFVKFFNVIFSLFGMLILSHIAIASIDNGKCGGTDFLVKIKDADRISATFELYYQTNTNQKELFYSPLADKIRIGCIKTKEKKDLLLIEEFCTGSVCSDDGVYAVYDPLAKKMLIKSDFTPQGDYKYEYESDELRIYEKKNHRQVAKLIGYKPPFLPSDKKIFCCSRSQY